MLTSTQQLRVTACSCTALPRYFRRLSVPCQPHTLFSPTTTTTRPILFLSCAALTHVRRAFHTTAALLQQESAPTPTTPPSPPASTSLQQSLPSLQPVLEELRTIITRRYLISEVHRALSPAARKVLIAHKLPLQELLLHMPKNFVLCRESQNRKRVGGMIYVSPPHLRQSEAGILRLPPNTKPLPALAALLGPAAAETAAGSAAPAAATDAQCGVGTGFVDANSTPLDRLQEVLTYVPNEWTPFQTLKISVDVKMRCFGFPAKKCSTFFLQHPNYFDVRMQHMGSHTFEVRRSLALQKQLQEAAQQQQQRR